MARFPPLQDTTQMILPHERLGSDHRSLWPWKRWFGKDDAALPRSDEQGETPRPNIARRISRKAIPGLPRPGTFKRQQSELRDNLEPVKSKPRERRAFSVDPRGSDQLRGSSRASAPSLPRTSAPVLMGTTMNDVGIATKEQQMIPEAAEPEILAADIHEDPAPVHIDVFDDDLEEELEKKWILNLSMHFRDRSNREKFFVTYAETPTHWRRVTISLDYREAPTNSLEEELQQTQYQRDKSARIYEAIRESLPDIQFYDTVTNLKLQTENERLHVHVTEDIHEVIHFPPVTAISHLLYCRKVKEQDLVFDSHLSGFVYKVTVNSHVFIKKEIPGPDTVEEFLYEVNALHRLSGSDSVIQFGGVITDNEGTHLKGLLISFAEKGALIDVIYDGKGELSWPRRERWAKQIVQGLSEIHEAGFVQGDFTLSNIVIDGEDKAKIIDINRRGCPVGWEPPEVAALIESKQRISMYIGVKSDIFQLGMVLWAIAMQQDEPEIQPRPLTLASAPDEIPSYFRALVGICLSDDPRTRCHTSYLLTMFPEMENDDGDRGYGSQPASDHAENQYIDPANAVERDDIDNFRLLASQTTEIPEPALSIATHTYVNAPTDMSGESYFFPTRGRSPPRPAIEERESRPGEHSPSYANNSTGWIGVSMLPECEPRVIDVSPGRHYLNGDEVDTRSQDNMDEADVDFSTPCGNAAPKDRTNARAQTYGDAENSESDTLFIGNISFEASEDLLSEAFGEHGTVVNVRLPTDMDSGNHKGFGYVTFYSAEDAKNALETMNGADIGGRPVRLDYAASCPGRDVGSGRVGAGGRDRGGRDGFDNRGGGGHNMDEGGLIRQDAIEETIVVSNQAIPRSEATQDATEDASDNSNHVFENIAEDSSNIHIEVLEGRTNTHGGTIEDINSARKTSGDVGESTTNIRGTLIAGNNTVSGDASEGHYNVAESPKEPTTNLPRNSIEDDGSEGARNASGEASGSICSVRGNVIDNSSAAEETNNPIGNIPAKATEDNNIVSKDATKPDNNIPYNTNGTAKKSSEDATKIPTGALVGSQSGRDSVEAFTAARTGEVIRKDSVIDMEDQGRLRQMGRAASDLTGIGGHSTLEYSGIPQGISDDDLMTETRR